jgi:hypothetical protein
MVKCLHEGAADYLLKPLCEDVVKTLFLVSVFKILFSYFSLINIVERHSLSYSQKWQIDGKGRKCVYC